MVEGTVVYQRCEVLIDDKPEVNNFPRVNY